MKVQVFAARPESHRGWWSRLCARICGERIIFLAANGLLLHLSFKLAVHDLADASALLRAILSDISWSNMLR